MSYALTPYLVDLKQLRSAVGSYDHALLKAVIRELPAEPEDGEGGELSLKTAVTHLVMGEEVDEESAHQYGYALERLCRHLGTRLDSGLWDAVRWSAIEATGLDTIIEESGSPVPLPHIPDFPGIGQIPADRIRAALQEVQEKQDATGEDEIRDLLKDYEGWLQTALAQKKALVLFYY